MFTGWEQGLYVVGGVALQLCLAGLVLVRRPQRQSSALAWILLILLLPVIGAACFLLFGDVRTGSPRTPGTTVNREPAKGSSPGSRSSLEVVM